MFMNHLNIIILYCFWADVVMPQYTVFI